MTTMTTTRSTMRIRSSARTRIVLSVLALLAVSTAVSTLALRQILLARVDDRIEAGLAQEVAEFRRLAEQTGLTDVQQLFDQFLVRDIPDDGEASFTFVGERPYRSNADLGTGRRLLDRVRELGEVDRVARGDIEGTRYLAVPVTDDGARRGTFVVTADLERERAEVSEAVQRRARRRRWRCWGWWPCSRSWPSGASWRRCATLTATARSIESTEDLTRRIEVTGDDEIAELGRTFNAMLDRLERRSRCSARSSRTRSRAAHADHDHPRAPRLLGDDPGSGARPSRSSPTSSTG